MRDLTKVRLVLDIDGVIRDVAGSYRRALADTVEHFTQGNYRPTPQDIDRLKAEGVWNNDWEASQELIRRYFAQNAEMRSEDQIPYDEIVSFFQSRYRGDDWTGYIAQEPLIATTAYFEALAVAGIRWGFFSGATRGSASYALKRLGLDTPILVAMEDAPGKPDPTGLFNVVASLEARSPHAETSLVIYVGDTVADMMTLVKARAQDPSRRFVAVGVIPPHVEDRTGYTDLMKSHGADLMCSTILDLSTDAIANFL